jgi:cysteinyl-tRNA synthetase
MAEKETSEKQDENTGVDPELLAYINAKIEERKNAKKAKDFALADAIRGELLERGITLLDTREGTKFTIG